MGSSRYGFDGEGVVVDFPVVDPQDSFSRHEVRVRAMMMGFGQELPEKPTVADYKTRELRVRLMLEEVMEYAEAAGVQVGVSGYAQLKFSDLHFRAHAKPDIVAMADAVADISVVMTGTSVAHGFPLAALQEEVDKENMRKIQNGHLDENGKFIKGGGHVSGDFLGVLIEHGYQN